ncbi:hypothetical protein Pelo_13943 [Pelomyxa schiedti]|nr:hypothetical protein Pelo_13943 [Pelomyxa schiedti]
MMTQEAISIRCRARDVIAAVYVCKDVVIPKVFTHIRKERAERSSLQLIHDEQVNMDDEFLKMSGLQLSAIINRCRALVDELQALSMFYVKLAQWFECAAGASIPQSSSPTATTALPPPPAVPQLSGILSVLAEVEECNQIATTTPVLSIPVTQTQSLMITEEIAQKIMQTVHLCHSVMYVDPSRMQVIVHDATMAVETICQIAYPVTGSVAPLTTVIKFASLCRVISQEIQAISEQYAQPLEAFVELQAIASGSSTPTPSST